MKLIDVIHKATGTYDLHANLHTQEANHEYARACRTLAEISRRDMQAECFQSAYMGVWMVISVVCGYGWVMGVATGLFCVVFAFMAVDAFNDREKLIQLAKDLNRLNAELADSI